MSLDSLAREYDRKFGVKKAKHHHKRRMTVSNQGWENEPARHSMSAYGLKSGRKQRTYSQKPVFKSEPLIRAGVGSAMAVAGFLKKRAEENKRKAQEKKARELQEKKDNEERWDGEVTQGREPIENKISFVKELKKRQAEQTYKKAQENALRQRDEQYARTLEARKPKETKEEIEEDYASV